MAQHPPHIEVSDVTLSPSAEFDLAEVHTYTTRQHGLLQADRYVQFLAEGMGQLARMPHIGRPIAHRPGLLGHILKWQKARHGHKIIYEPDGAGIYVLRILHTAMNLTDHIGDA